MDRPSVKLKLELAGFDEAPFLPLLARCRRDGIAFETLGSLGDTPANRRRLYELNRDCSRDIPGRGAFFSFEDYCEARFERPAHDPRGTILALDGKAWIGLTVLADWRHKGFVFNDMTGVLRSHRRRGIATALKLLGIRFALSCGVDRFYTIHDAENAAAIDMNRRLGYSDTDWDKLV